ncbi:hypothetical protein C3747_60g170 [Trypanosoma cruzi]|uniref:SET domain-containing protein n=2 Tax=Trypanosoma cruzi TaxID=5693 RepID=Q4CU83_TRYCC|nr:hypothetical protein, conserved [Trypanosoma cruzi]EAN83834.1 hypothetical protein, conserved [Trypanosoma cruzi]PWV11305.1 hypothetical protein C3747_60g170 [Trypanosoma cruzi]RNC40582.1 hypothetical protein TcCL_NonESM09921 [Trypanosoma cruzi]|eukprot:XP_805685.1 hypothetical protein [Trypanosoma cruzi strain CL Brener]
MEDASCLVLRWEKRLEGACGDSGNSVNGGQTRGLGQQRQAQTQAAVAEAASVGMALLKLLLQMEQKEDEMADDDKDAKEGTETALPHQRLTQLLVEVVLAILDSCIQWTGTKNAVQAVCCELMAASSREKGQDDLAEKLCDWWDHEEVAEQAWRWCEAHLTLLPADEAAWRYGASHGVATPTDWWWRPDAMTSANSNSLSETTAAAARSLFQEVYATVSQQCIAESPRTELATAKELLHNLFTLPASFFFHRIAVSRGVLQRLFTMKATALLHQAHLLTCLAFLKNAAQPRYTEKSRKTSGGGSSHELLWVSRECLSLAWKNLISSITAVQVATIHFGASCGGLRQQVRRALFGVKEVASETDGTFSSCEDFFYVHPSVEPSENACRVTHGVGLVATGKISEGSVMLQERSLLFHSSPDQTAAKTEMQNNEMSNVTGAALELFRRGGMTFISDAVTSQVVESLQSGAFFGEPTQAGEMWNALHLIATMQPADRNSIGTEDGFARDIADLVRCWTERAIPFCPVEEFRIELEGAPGEGKGLYPFAGFINHSCSPNAVFVFGEEEGACCSSRGGVLRVVALCDIEPGEEITVTYLSSLLLSRELKRERNGFYCCCTFCLSYAALLEGVVCPTCQQLVYDDHNDKEEVSSKAVDVVSSVRANNTANGRVKPYAHLPGCAYAGYSSYKDLAGPMKSGFKKIIDNIHCELLGRSITDAVHEHGNCMQEGFGAGETEKYKEEEDDDDKKYAQRAQKAVRQLMDLDTLASGLPSTHHYRLQARMECLATSLNAIMTPNDVTRLMQLCEKLLEDLEVLLPRNYPLLTGIRLHYALARSRYLIATTDINDPAADGYPEGCCGSVREQAEMMRLPFMRDAIIRECVVRSFQEHYVYTGWRFAEANDEEILQSFLRRYEAELFACGVEELSHFNMLSLMFDAAEGGSG